MNDPLETAKIAIVGAGMMGQGCAHAFAARGYRVGLHEVKPLEVAIEGIRRDMAFLVDQGHGRAEDAEAAFARIHFTQDLEAAVDSADFVIECVFEDLALKKKIFRQLERLVGPEVVLATNTSVIRITEIAEACSRRDRVIGTHWWNPAYIVPLVEVVPGEKTAAETVQTAVALLQNAGKLPVVLKKDIPGFIGNRLIHALYREAFSIVEQGAADASTVDLAFKFGPGMRFPVLGPFEHMDLVGADLVLSVQNYLFKYLENSEEPSETLKSMVARGELGFKTGGVGCATRSCEEQKSIRDGLLKYLASQMQPGENSHVVPLPAVPSVAGRASAH